MDTKTILKQTIWEYAEGGGINLELFPVANEEKMLYGVVMIDTPIYQDEPALMVLARIAGSWIIIEADNSDHPLYQALVERGITRENIICAYAGEALPSALLAPAI